jgi:hypothetical protein
MEANGMYTGPGAIPMFIFTAEDHELRKKAVSDLGLAIGYSLQK